MDGHQPTSSQPTDPTQHADFVTALARGIKVIRAFNTNSSKMTLADISRRVGLPRATVRRSLITLERLGYAESDGRCFSLTPKVLALGTSYLCSAPLPRAAQPMLERLSEMTRESCWTAILDEDDALVVACAKTNRILSAGLSVGSRLPAYCSALGRVLLAGLPDERLNAYLCRLTPRSFTSRTTIEINAIRRAILDVRSAGYAFIDGEVELGLSSLAVPITDSQGRTAAALNVTAPSDRVPRTEMIERFLPHLQRAADNLQLVLV